jgi:hypothetical protein
MSPTFKRRHPLIKGISHFCKSQAFLLYKRRLLSIWKQNQRSPHQVSLQKNYTFSIFKACINIYIFKFQNCNHYLLQFISYIVSNTKFSRFISLNFWISNVIGRIYIWNGVISSCTPCKTNYMCKRKVSSYA